MDSISIRYGETVTLPIDTGEVTAVSADLYVGRAGEMYVIHQNITLTDGTGTFVIDADDTRVPIGTYYYQINVTDESGYVTKYPSPEGEDCDDCENEFPEFVICESLDEIEVS